MERFFWSMAGWGARLIRRFLADNCPQQSAAIAYYAMGSLFPGLLLLITALGQFMVAPEAQRHVIHAVATYFPVPSLQDYVAQNLRGTLNLRHTMGFLGVAALLWASKALFQGLESGLNTLWRLPERRSTWVVYLTAITLTLLVGLVMALQCVFSGLAHAFFRYPVFHLAGRTLDLSRFSPLYEGFQWFLSPLVLFGIFCLLYLTLPTRQVPFSAVWPGAMFAAIAWKLVQSGFLIYTTRIAVASALYGAASIVLALMLWLYLSAMIFFLGAELIYMLLERRGLLR